MTKIDALIILLRWRQDVERGEMIQSHSFGNQYTKTHLILGEVKRKDMDNLAYAANQALNWLNTNLAVSTKGGKFLPYKACDSCGSPMQMDVVYCAECGSYQ